MTLDTMLFDVVDGATGTVVRTEECLVLEGPMTAEEIGEALEAWCPEE